MTLLDEEEKLLLAQARREFTPESRQARRVHAAVLTTIALQQSAALTDSVMAGSKASVTSGAAGSTPLASVSQGLGALSTKAWLAGVALALGVTAGAGLWALGRAEPTPHAPAPRLSAAPAALQAAPVTSPSASSNPEMRGHGVPAAPANEPEPSSQPAETTRRPPRSIPSARSRTALDLGEELAGVREAEQALNAGDAGRALAILHELERAAGGDLREERAALRVLAHCQLGSTTSGERARRFLSTYRNSVYAVRVRAACEE